MTDFNQHPAVKLAQTLIHFPSFTPVTAEGYAPVSEALGYLGNHGRDHGGRALYFTFPPRGEPTEDYQVPNLLVVWKKGNWEACPHVICFLGHLDVVPLGDETLWSVNPFGGDIVGPFLYGRGATDMKGADAAFFTAAAAIMADDTVPNAHFMAVITGDEEWEAKHGTREVLRTMKAQDIIPTAFLVGEPSSPAVLGTHFKNGRRGSLNVRVTIAGEQGHAAYPELFRNPNRILGKVAETLQGITWLDNKPKGKGARTNLEVTSVHSGSGSTAIIPATAELRFNIRYAATYTQKRLLGIIKARLRKKLKKKEYAALTFEVTGNSLPYQSKKGVLQKALREAVENVTGNKPKADNSGGTTDGRFVQEFFPHAEVIEFGPPENGGSPLAHPLRGDIGGMHQADERILVEDVSQLSLIYTKLLLTVPR